MRKARVLALRKASQGGAFLIMHQHELDVLDALPLWFDRLFRALIHCSDFRTGAGQVSYARLVALLTPKHYAPDAQAIKKAVRELEARLIVARDKAHSQAEQLLFFAVAPRYAEVRQKAELEPQTRTPPKPRKASNDAGSSVAVARTRTPDSNPSFNKVSVHSKEGELSTPKSSRTVVAMRQRLRAGAGGPLK